MTWHVDQPGQVVVVAVGAFVRDGRVLLALTAGDGVADLRLSIWSVQGWLGAPHNRCPEEHDRLAWFGAGDLAGLALAHDLYEDLLGRLLRAG